MEKELVLIKNMILTDGEVHNNQWNWIKNTGSRLRLKVSWK